MTPPYVCSFYLVFYAGLLIFVDAGIVIFVDAGFVIFVDAGFVIFVDAGFVIFVGWVVDGCVAVVDTGLVVVVDGCVAVVDTGLVVVVDGCVAVVDGCVAVVVDAFFSALFSLFCSNVILFCTSVLFTFLFSFGIPRNSSVGAIIMHVTKSITKRNIIERVIPLLNMVVILYKTLTQ
jgi:hypothetical protein